MRRWAFPALGLVIVATAVMTVVGREDNALAACDGAERASNLPRFLAARSGEIAGSVSVEHLRAGRNELAMLALPLPAGCYAVVYVDYWADGGAYPADFPVAVRCWFAARDDVPPAYGECAAAGVEVVRHERWGDRTGEAIALLRVRRDGVTVRFVLHGDGAVSVVRLET